MSQYYVIVSRNGAVNADGKLDSTSGRLFDNLADAETAAASFSKPGTVGRPRKYRIVAVSVPQTAEQAAAPAAEPPKKKARVRKAKATPAEVTA